MKRNLRLTIFIIILCIITFGMYKLAFSKKWNSKTEDFSELRKYISDIYGTTFLIPEFDDINDAEEDWLWENVNQYVWNHDDDYKEKNSQEYGYTYEDISKIVKILYGDTLQKSFPRGAISMRYNAYRNLYGPTSFGVSNYYDYKIDNITKNGNNYQVSLYDYTVSSEEFLGEDISNTSFKIFNNYDYILNRENGTPIITIKTLNDKSFNNILDKKDKLSHKILTIIYDEPTNLYHIKSCIYKDTKSTEILSDLYNKMQLTFETISIDYNYEDIYTQDEIIINNFDELTSIYTDNAINTYKEEMDMFVYKNNGDVYIKPKDITIENYISKIEFKDIKEDNNKISCNVIRTFRESFDPTDNKYNNTYQKENTFTIIKENDKWLVDEFSYNR